MAAQTRQKAVIIGAGIGGLSAAVALSRVGIDVEVYERASDLRTAGCGIGVMGNAIAALRALDIDLDLEKRGQTIRHSEINTARGRTLRKLPLHETADGLSSPGVVMTRGDLQSALMDALGEFPLTLNAAATGYDVARDGVRVRFADGREARGDVLIGADGINSVIRRTRTGDSEGEPRYGGFLCWLAVTSLAHPRITTGYGAHYWGPGRRFGLHDIGHGRVYWWGTLNLAATAARWSGDKDVLDRAYSGWADEVRLAIMTTPADDILAVPAQDRPFLERWGDGPVTLLGDAAHPMLPSLAQGGSSAIEGAVVLAQCLASRADPVAALRTYEDLRRDRTRKMVEVSRRLGAIEQLTHPVLRGLRDSYLRLAPSSVIAKPFTTAFTPQLLAS